MIDQFETVHEHQMRAAIFEATADLLRAYSYKKLRVKDICRVAEVSIPTFYRYYSDKYAIAEWAFASYMRPSKLSMIREATLEQYYRANIAHLRAYRDFYQKAYAPSNADTLLDLNIRVEIEQMEERLYQVNGVERSERLDFQIRYTAHAIPTITAKWLVDYLLLSDDDLVEVLLDTVPRELHDLYDHVR